MLGLLPLLIATLQGGNATAIVGVAVVRSDRPEVDRNQTVIVRDGIISWIGPADRAPATGMTRRIDGRGKYLLPGFADMHVHLSREADLVTYVANGITTVRNMWGQPHHLDWRARTAAGTLLGPRIVTAGPILDGDPPSESAMTVLTDPARVRAEVIRQHDAGYDFIKVYNSLPRAVYDSVLVVAREAGMSVAGHVPFGAGLRGVLSGGQRSIEHFRGYIALLVPATAPIQPGASLKSRTLAWNNVDETRFPDLVRETVASGIWNCPTLMVTGELLAPPDRWAALAARPVLRYLGPDAAGDRSGIPYLRDFTPDDFREAAKGVSVQRRLALALHRAGGRLLAGTDSYLQGFALATELAELEASGLTPWEVLMVATRNPAEYFGEAGAWGVVKPGARADLQLLDANPIDGLGALARRAGVMVAGRWYPAADLVRRLERVAAADPAALRP